MIYSLIVTLLDPLTLTMLALGAALGVTWLRRPEMRAGLRLPLAMYGLVWLAASTATAYWAAGALEWRFPPLDRAPPDAEAIVVLSGGVLAPNSFQPAMAPSTATLRRCAEGARLYHRRGGCPLLICGGKVDPSRAGGSEAEAMRRTLLDMGVAGEDLIVDDRSTDTFENAVHARELLQPRGISHVVLVTDGTHLYRAVRIFRGQQLTVTPASAYYATSTARGRVTELLPHSGAAEINRAVFHELVGLLWHKIRGRI